MAEKEDIRQSIRQLVKADNNIDTSKKCYVRNVSAGTTDGLMICDCEPLDGTSVIQDVLLTANFDNEKAGLVLVPKIDSVVVVSFIKHDNDNAQAFVSMVSEVDNVYINGNGYGGLVKVVDLVTHLNTSENKINALISAITAWTPVAGDGGAALKAALTSWLASSITPTTQSDIESTKVRHGDGSIS